jgi:hypothetical protein
MWFTLGGVLGLLIAWHGQRIGRVYAGFGALLTGFLFGVIALGVPLWLIFKVGFGIGVL